MDMTTETKSAAARFLADHEQQGIDLANARTVIDDQNKEIDRLVTAFSIQKDMLSQATTDRNIYLQYAFELSAQLQFIVAGSARALMIANSVRQQIAMKSANIPDVSGANVAELEDILKRIGDQNATANDGKGMTNDDRGDGKPVVSGKPQTNVRELLPDNAGTDTATNGVLVNRDGTPVEMSDATRMLKTA